MGQAIQSQNTRGSSLHLGHSRQGFGVSRVELTSNRWSMSRLMAVTKHGKLHRQVESEINTPQSKPLGLWCFASHDRGLLLELAYGGFPMSEKDTRPFLFPEGKSPLLQMDLQDVVPLIQLVELHRYNQWGDLMELSPAWRYYFVGKLQLEYGYVPDTVLDNVPDTPSGAFAVMHSAEVWTECVKGTVKGTHPPALY